MNKTYNQLWWDKDFIEARIEQQKEENRNLHNRCLRDEISIVRCIELQNSTLYVKARLEKQLKLINKLK